MLVCFTEKYSCVLALYGHQNGGYGFSVSTMINCLGVFTKMVLFVGWLTINNFGP